jgi:hypothetical protein
MIFAVRPCSKEEKNVMQWSRPNNGQMISKRISGRAFMPTLFDLFGWKKEYTYRVIGSFSEMDGNMIIMFNLKETEILIPDHIIQEQSDGAERTFINRSKDKVHAYPSEWSSGFGINFYYQAQADEFAALSLGSEDICAASEPYKEPELQTTDIGTISSEIDGIMEDLSNHG